MYTYILSCTDLSQFEEKINYAEKINFVDGQINYAQGK